MPETIKRIECDSCLKMVNVTKDSLIDDGPKWNYIECPYCGETVYIEKEEANA